MKRLEIRIYIDVDNENCQFENFEQIESSITSRYDNLRRIDLIDEIEVA